jgi:hypothetical protein
MEMFNLDTLSQRIGPNLERSGNIDYLREVEIYFNEVIKSYDIEFAYDIGAGEVPYFKTLMYTEWARSFIMSPLNVEVKLRQIADATADVNLTNYDYVGYIKSSLIAENANKYANRVVNTTNEIRPNLVVLPGDNKLKSTVCLNKLRQIKADHGNDVWFKPHPITSYKLVGELKDIFGNDCVLDRDEDVYRYLIGADRVYTSHSSETAVYAISLDKIIEPIDVYHLVHRGSFYFINKSLFTVESPKEWLNHVMNSSKSGIINPVLDPNWKQKIDDYLIYIMGVRETFKGKYLALPKKSAVTPKDNPALVKPVEVNTNAGILEVDTTADTLVNTTPWTS